MKANVNTVQESLHYQKPTISESNQKSVQPQPVESLVMIQIIYPDISL